MWGTVKSTLTGKLFASDLPAPKDFYVFKRNKIQDLKSGSNHMLILSRGRAYSFGDNDTGALGTVLRGRLETTKISDPCCLGLKKVARIFTGQNHSFLIND